MPQFASYKEVQIWKQASRESDEERLKNGSASVDDLRRANGLGYSLSYKNMRIGGRVSGVPRSQRQRVPA